MPRPERMIEDKFISTSEAARIAHVNETTIRDWFDAGYISGVSMPYGERIHRRISLASLLAYLERLEAGL